MRTHYIIKNCVSHGWWPPSPTPSLKAFQLGLVVCVVECGWVEYAKTKCLYCSLLFSAFACALSVSVKFNKINVHLKIKFKIQNKSKTRTKKKCASLLSLVITPKYINRNLQISGENTESEKWVEKFTASTPSHTHINTFQIHFSTRSGFSWSLRIDYCTTSNRKSEAALFFFSSVGVNRNRFGNCAL